MIFLKLNTMTAFRPSISREHMTRHVDDSKIIQALFKGKKILEGEWG